MEYLHHKPHLFTDLDKDIRARHWYRQRFDACPHFMFFLGDAHTSRIQRTAYPFGQRIAFAGFSKNRADWYHSTDELWRTANAIVDAAKTDAAVSRRMYAAFQLHAEAFYELCRNLEATDLSKYTDASLLDLYHALADVYTNKLLASPLIDGFALVTDEVLVRKIREHVNAQGQAERWTEIFEILTAPVFTSFLAQEEIALSRIIEESASPHERDKRLEQHQRAFFWIQNNYVSDHVLDVSFFRARCERLTPTQARLRREELEELGKRHAERKEELARSLDIPPELEVLIRITDDFASWQDERKKGTFFATHAFTQLLQEMARRTGYTLDELVYALPPEMDRVVKKDLDPRELRQRQEYCMILWSDHVYDVTTDRRLIDELDAIGTGTAEVTQELRGFSASRGQAQGTVRVIESAQDVHRVQEGDVLVAVMTRPDYLAGMKKAAAFVTDEGGITCHAAIVAREMNKPCVIGTKYATKILKDGMRVEVDADKGIVRPLDG